MMGKSKQKERVSRSRSKGRGKSKQGARANKAGTSAAPSAPWRGCLARQPRHYCCGRGRDNTTSPNDSHATTRFTSWNYGVLEAILKTQESGGRYTEYAERLYRAIENVYALLWLANFACEKWCAYYFPGLCRQRHSQFSSIC